MFHGGQDDVEGFVVGSEVRCKPPLVPDVGRQPFLFENGFYVLEDLGAHPPCLGKPVRTNGHDHELLQIDVVIGVGPAVKYIHHGHR